MGLDYTFAIFTPHSQFWPTLNAIQDLQCHNCDRREDLVAIAHQALASVGGKTEAWVDERNAFLSLQPLFYVAPDDRILPDIDRMGEAAYDHGRVFVPGGVELNLYVAGRDDIDGEHCEFRFEAVTTLSSRIMEESTSFRNTLLQIAIDNGAYCCYLDKEDSGIVYLLDGVVMSREIRPGWRAGLGAIRRTIPKR